MYLAFCALMYFATPATVRVDLSIGELARLLVLSIIPIALAYHLAHYLSFLLIVGQYMIPLPSDPFGFGWNLFGTTLYMVDIGIVNARFVWITSVIAIVTGHIIAVWLAHVVALRRFRDSRVALPQPDSDALSDGGLYNAQPVDPRPAGRRDHLI